MSMNVYLAKAQLLLKQAQANPNAVVVALLLGKGIKYCL
jgi:hypothetical protein